jgi:DNA-binding XRE family transcriptional regulator
MSNLARAATALKIQKQNQTAQTTGQNIAQAINNGMHNANFVVQQSNQFHANQAPAVSVSPSRTAMQNIQATIKAERKAQQLTQRQLASKAGMSQASITRLERHGWVSIYTMIRVIDALGKQLTIA